MCRLVKVARPCLQEAWEQDPERPERSEEQQIASSPTAGEVLESVVNRCGSLKNGNSPGDFSKAPRCGAKTRKGTACQAPAMRNGRCQLHGGKSTGPRTPEGIERIRRAATKHGWYSKAAKAERRRIRELVRACNAARADLKKRLKSLG